MVEGPSRPIYGSTRERRASVSYAELERAAAHLLKSGVKPGIESLRQTLGGGSPQTIQALLSRFWRELGERIDGPAPALARMPSDVADLADELWRRALMLASQAATQGDNAARERLEQLGRDHEVRSHALALREKELSSLLEARERTSKELESHLRTTMSLVARGQATIRSLEAKVAAAEIQTAEYRERLATIVARIAARPRVQGAKRAASVPKSKSMRPSLKRPSARKKRKSSRRR